MRRHPKGWRRILVPGNSITTPFRIARLTRARDAIYTLPRAVYAEGAACFAKFHVIERGPTVNKNELVDTVAELSGLKKGEAEKTVDAVFDTIASALKKGDEVRIVGFGTFMVSERAASQGRNPRTGEAIAIAASKQPKFRAGKGLKDAIR
jgi:DNA-binding protein HU-beta